VDITWRGSYLARLQPEDRLLLLCARRRFTDAHRTAAIQVCTAAPLRWERIYAASVNQGIAPLVYSNLVRCSMAELGIPPGVVTKFRVLVGRNLVTQQILANQLIRTLDVLSGLSIDAMLIKGAALDYLLDSQRALTISKDIDLVLRIRPDEVTKSIRKDLAAACAGYPIEYDFFDHHDVTLNGALPVDFERIWRDADSIRLGDKSVRVMCPEDFLIVSCINACRKRYVRLKALVDAVEILEAYPALDWDSVARRARSDQCAAIVYATLFILDLLQATRVPEAAFKLPLAGRMRAASIRLLLHHLPAWSWTVPASGLHVFNRSLDVSLVLPYVTYRWDQVLRKLGFIWHSRRTLAPGGRTGI
jgi:hypothetical protein